jgi:hypothetical protein
MKYEPEIYDDEKEIHYPLVEQLYYQRSQNDCESL